MALGGVATGSMNANEVDSVTGRAKYRGLVPSFSAFKFRGLSFKDGLEHEQNFTHQLRDDRDKDGCDDRIRSDLCQKGQDDDEDDAHQSYRQTLEKAFQGTTEPDGQSARLELIDRLIDSLID